MQTRRANPTSLPRAISSNSVMIIWSGEVVTGLNTKSLRMTTAQLNKGVSSKLGPFFDSFRHRLTNDSVASRIVSFSWFASDATAH